MHRMALARGDSLWTGTFALLCLAQFLGYAQQFMLTPALPLYVTHLGHSPLVVGVVLAAFAVASVVVRPLVGFWADSWNETGVLISGLLFQGAAICLFFIPVVEATMLANGLRGVGWAGLNTGGYSLLASRAPMARRGEAAGYYSAAQYSAGVLFPAAALWLIAAPQGGFRAVFGTASTLAVLGACAGLLLARRAPNEVRVSPPAERVRWQFGVFHLLEREVLLATALLFCLNLSFPAVTSFLVLYARDLGVGNLGWYFVASGVTNVLARPVLGRVCDGVGRAASLAAAFALVVGALLLLTRASSLLGLTVSGVLWILGSAIGSSASIVIAMERADPKRRGRAMATFSIAYPLSSGVGALLAGGAVEAWGFAWMFAVVAAMSTSGLILTLTHWSTLK